MHVSSAWCHVLAEACRLSAAFSSTYRFFHIPFPHDEVIEIDPEDTMIDSSTPEKACVYAQEVGAEEGLGTEWRCGWIIQ